MLAILLLVPTVAVMPFRDLSNGGGHAGDAISETVTADLRDVPGLRVVERSEIERVIAEQNLQAKKNDLDAAGSIRVGTLLGATLIVAGAYQRVDPNVRLTARFVDVATGEVKGSAKVDGRAQDFLSLQDRVTGELIKSAGLAAAPRRARAKLRSWRPIELYGDALAAPDDDTRRKLLRQALNEDPGFVYAARDLDLLEKRLRHYDDAAARAKEDQVRSLYAQVTHEKDPMKLYMAYVMLLSELFTARRYRRVIELGRAIVASPPPVPPDRGLEELARQMTIGAYLGLSRLDDVLHDGEIYVAKFPAGHGFATVRWQLDRAIEMKRKAADGKEKAAAEIAQHPRDDDCQKAGIYERHSQLPEARQKFEAGLVDGCRMGRMSNLTALLWLCVRQADRPCAEKYSAAVEAEPIGSEGVERQRATARKWIEQIVRDD